MTQVTGASVGEAASRVRGIALMVAAFSLFALLDASAKFLSGELPTAQIVWARYVGHLAIVLVVYAALGRWQVWRTANLKLQVVRSALLLLGTTLNFMALRHLQLAETASIAFSIPLWVAVLAVPLLGERIGMRRWGAVIAGFLGVLIIVRPGFGLLHWAVFLSLAMALITALYQIATRKLAPVDHPDTTQFYTAMVGACALAPLAPITWTVPASATTLVPLVALGVCGALGHYLLILAHRLAPAPILAPFSYTQIVWMVGLGYLVFGDLPDAWTLAGGAVVVGSGLYLLHRERVRKRQG